MHILRFRHNQLAHIARRNRQEIAESGLSRRELYKMGLLTAAGLLIPKRGLSSHDSGNCYGGGCDLGCSPPTDAFELPLTIPPVLPERQLSEFTPAPNIAPNRTINPANGLPFEGRTEDHQSRINYPVEKYFMSRMGAVPAISIHPDLPLQTNFWGFNLGDANLSTDKPVTPAPTVVARYGDPILVRRFNNLPPSPGSGGFGVPEVSTHLHNFHSAPDSDGGPCDPVQQRYFFRGQYYDYYHNMQRAGFASTHPPNGDIKETLGTLWYHDHRVDHTAENAYKGMAGFQILFNDYDTGDENTGFHLPSWPQFDIPLMLTDKLFDSSSGQLCFDTFDLDGLIGDKYLVNGRIQPFFEVQKRRYRFRILDGGPSRFYQLYLTNPDNLNQSSIPFYVIANDGNLLQKPVSVTNHRLGVAERVDIIIDFAKIAQQFGATRLWLENRLEQTNGQGPETYNAIQPRGNRNNTVLEFRLTGNPVIDLSVDPVTLINNPATCVFNPICLPTTSANDPNAQPRITRTFEFERDRDGEWEINGKLMDCTQFRFTVQKNSIEKWILKGGRSWAHPIHIHLEEFQILKRNGSSPSAVERSRKDVVRLEEDDEVELFFRFRDYRGGYPIHCHNTIHEDHQMMLIFDVQDVGDWKTEP